MATPRQYPAQTEFHGASIPKVAQLAALFFIFGTGTLPQMLQAMLEGVGSGESGFAAALLTGLLYDLLRAAPLIVLSRHPTGVLHPIIVAVVIWPLLTELPSIIDDFGGYAGLLAGEQLRPLTFTALAWRDEQSAWLDMAFYNALQIVALLSLYAGFAFVSPAPARRIKLFSDADSYQLRRILIGLILLNLVAVAVFIQLRGGLIEHIANLAYGRFRALSGLGPFLALFDTGFVCLLIWICVRPMDARNPLFLVLLGAIGAQQFVVSGSRSAMLIVFVLVGLGWMLRTGRIPWRLALLLLPIAFFSFGALNIIRTAGVRNTTAVEAVQDASFAQIVETSRAEFEDRQRLAGSVPVVVDGMRTTGPMWGYTYSGALFALVPRALWEDKPRGPGSIYAQTFLGESREGMSVPVSPVAEAFWNFHIVGIIVLFALYGAIIKQTYRVYEANRSNGVVIAGFVLFVTQFGVGTEQFVAAQQSALTFALVVLIVRFSYPRRAGARTAVHRQLQLES